MDQEKALVQRPAQDLIPEVRNMEGIAKYLLESKLFPNAGNLPGVITIIEYGRELGLPPVAALQTMVVINGKLAMEAKAMLAVANRNAGVTWKVMELNEKGCKMIFMRPGFENAVVEFATEEAKTAGLLTKTNWKLYLQDMLFARCASRGVRRIAPDAVLGLYSTEEMKDVEALEKMGVKVPEDKELPTVPRPGAKRVEGGERPDKKVPPEGGGVPVEQAPAPLGDFPMEEPPEVELPPLETYLDEEEEPKFSDDAVLNSYIAEIHQAVERAGVDDAKFKEWLVGQGKKMNRQFVGKIGKVLRLHKGKPEDVKYLQSVIDRAIGLYIKETSNE